MDTLTASGTDFTNRIVVFGLPGHSRFSAAGVMEVLDLAREITETGGDNHVWVPLSAHSGAGDDASSEWENLIDPADKAILIVVGGWSPSDWRHSGFEAWLRRRARGGSVVGAIGSAVHTLARTGLLKNHKSALHWEALAGFRERHSELDANRHLYSIDKNRFTCAGGTAVLDMMIGLVANWYGPRVANQIACRMLHTNIRPPEVTLPMMSDASGRIPRQIKRLIGLMENNIEAPLSISELARNSALSTRQTQRLFHEHLNIAPLKLYREIRLEHARRLLKQTDLSVTEIAFASGFANSSHFTRCFKDQFDTTPHLDRISLPWVKETNPSGVSSFQEAQLA
jgi:AraC family transcriptional regulator, glycine betaine-responsive activator